LNNTSGGLNNAFGYQALYNTSGEQNIAIGYEALKTNNGNYNIGIGSTTSISGASYSTVIGYGATTTNSNEIVLGRSTETVVVKGNLSTANICNSVGICNLWTNSTGEINIGTLGGRSQIIHIGDGNSNLSGSSVHINNGTNTSSNVQILNGAGSTGTVNVGASGTVTNLNGIVNIANMGTSASNTNINGTVNLARNTTGTNPTYLECVSGTTNQYIDFHCNAANNIDFDARIIASGGTETAGQGDLQIQSKTLAISSPLTLNYTPSAITGTTQLGYKITGTAGTTTLTTNSPVIVHQATLTAGIWLLQGNVYFDLNDPTKYLFVSISANSLSIDYNAMTSAPATLTGLNLQVSRIVNTITDGGVGPWYLLAQTNMNPAGTAGFIKFNVYRIA